MAPKKFTKNKLIKAKLVSDDKAPCAFCLRKIDDEITYGKLYSIGDIQCHYFCVLLSSCLIQKGRDEDGLFGFLFDDIVAEVERSKKHKCSYCGHVGATLGCSVVQCKKQFHLPCGRERNAVSLFYGNYKSFCEHHTPKQKIPDHIMARAKIRMGDKKTGKRRKALSIDNDEAGCVTTEAVCVICYERVCGYPSPQSFWPPCCARDAWFHRHCLQRMALSAGVHYLKCPLCNDKENFYEAVVTQGYYVPDRDAAWELEQNAFSEIYERAVACAAAECSCPLGRAHDADTGPYSMKVCMLCGSSGSHAGCMLAAADTHPHLVCGVCRPAAPHDLHTLATHIEAVIISEEQRARQRVQRGPRMPSRMSLRRTKCRTLHDAASSSTVRQSAVIKAESQSQPSTQNTVLSRQDLNLKTPKRFTLSLSPSKQTDLFSSPIKLIQEGLRSKGESDVIDDVIAEELRKKFQKPKPLSKKKKIINDILNNLFEEHLKEPKQKEHIKEWCSPKKISDIKEEITEESAPVRPVKRALSPTTPTTCGNEISINSMLPSESILKVNDSHNIPTPKKLKTFDIHNSTLEISEKNEFINIDVLKVADTIPNGDYLKNLGLKSPVKSEKCVFKFSPLNNEVLDNDNIDMDVESFKNYYLKEVARDESKKSKKKSSKRKTSKEVILKYKTGMKKGKKNQKDNNIQVVIKWREERLKLKIKKSSKKKKLKNYKQYILKYASGDNSKIVKPDVDLTPKKRKYIKQEKSPDNLVQTSIDSFFKIKPTKE